MCKGQFRFFIPYPHHPVPPPASAQLCCRQARPFLSFHTFIMPYCSASSSVHAGQECLGSGSFGYGADDHYYGVITPRRAAFGTRRQRLSDVAVPLLHTPPDKRVLRQPRQAFKHIKPSTNVKRPRNATMTPPRACVSLAGCSNRFDCSRFRDVGTGAGGGRGTSSKATPAPGDFNSKCVSATREAAFLSGTETPPSFPPSPFSSLTQTATLDPFSSSAHYVDSDYLDETILEWGIDSSDFSFPAPPTTIPTMPRTDAMYPNPFFAEEFSAESSARTARESSSPWQSADLRAPLSPFFVRDPLHPLPRQRMGEHRYLQQQRQFHEHPRSTNCPLSTEVPLTGTNTTKIRRRSARTTRLRPSDCQLSIAFPDTAHFEVWDMREHDRFNVPILLCLTINNQGPSKNNPFSIIPPPRSLNLDPSDLDVTLLEVACEDVSIPAKAIRPDPAVRFAVGYSCGARAPGQSPLGSGASNVGGKGHSKSTALGKIRVDGGWNRMYALPRATSTPVLPPRRAALGPSSPVSRFGPPNAGSLTRASAERNHAAIAAPAQQTTANLPTLILSYADAAAGHPGEVPSSKGFYLKVQVPIPSHVFRRREMRLFKVEARLRVRVETEAQRSVFDDDEDDEDDEDDMDLGFDVDMGMDVDEDEDERDDGPWTLYAATQMSVSHLTEMSHLKVKQAT